MSSVLGKIDEDQRDVNQKSVENEELQLKLVQLCGELRTVHTYILDAMSCWFDI